MSLEQLLGLVQARVYEPLSYLRHAWLCSKLTAWHTARGSSREGRRDFYDRPELEGHIQFLMLLRPAAVEAEV